MFKRIRSRLDGNSEQGFTLIEFLVVIIIIGILLAIAVPSYLGFRDRAANNAMKENLRAALPAAEAYYSDNGTYVGMDAGSARAIDSGVAPALTVPTAADEHYCLAVTVAPIRGASRPGPSSTDFKNT